MHESLTLGSLFDGSGGFPLGAITSGIKPIWCSEIDPFCIRVTTKRLPQVKHLGDIHSLHGAAISPVNIITFGSPCTNVSCASSTRTGLRGKQSILFFEAIRIIQEMREATDGRYPRFIVFENVCGLQSSGKPKGSDFKSVLDAIIQIVEPQAEVPPPDKNGWPSADIYVGDGWSLAYRVLAAEHFGVAQRRHRIYLVADFASERAGEILFEQEGVRRDFAPFAVEGEGSAGNPEDSVDADCSGVTYAFEPGAASRLGRHVWKERSGALRADAGDNQTAVVYDARGNGNGSIAPALVGNHENRVTDFTALAVEPTALGIAGNIIVRDTCNGGNGIGVQENISYTLTSADRHACAYAMTPGSFMEIRGECALPLMARDYKDPQLVNTPNYTVRRLLPCECAMLQGCKPDWCAGLETQEPTDEETNWWAGVFETYRLATGSSTKPKSRNQIIKWLRHPHSDSAEYHMWGNGVCVQCVCFVLRGIVETSQNNHPE